MREMTDRLAEDEELAATYLAGAHAPTAQRDAIEPARTDVSAGGMPGRVKCLHVHVAHSLAVGPGLTRSETRRSRSRARPAGSCGH